MNIPQPPSLLQAFAQVLGVFAEGLARGLNVLLQYVSHFLQAAGIQGKLYAVQSGEAGSSVPVMLQADDESRSSASTNRTVQL